MLILQIIIVVIAGYFLGAIPFAVIIARRHGVDILKEGSGNPGATNVKRVIGKSAGNICFLLDALKGIVAAGWPLLVFRWDEHVALLGVVGLCAALAGHSASVFIRFRGGKGVATTIGGMIALCPLVIIIGVIVWLAMFYWKRYVSLASLCMAVSLPIAAWFLSAPIIFWFALFLAILLFVRHLSNIVRLWNGTENKFEKKSQQ